MTSFLAEKVHPLLLRSLFHITNREFMNARNTLSDNSPLQFSNKEAVMYIHFPFCSSSCSYCPFHKSMNLNEVTNYCKALLTEIALLKEQNRVNDTTVKALFFGGGTPSLMPLDALENIMQALKEQFGTIPQITLESNPESLSLDKALSYKRLGVNRLSIGVQSFHKEILEELDRKTRPIKIKKVISEIIGAGFTNISIDLIYGFQKQSENMLLSDIGEAITLGVEHISLFPLINYNQKSQQELTTKQYRHQFTLYKKAKKFLLSHGFHAYSVEDFTRTERAKNHYQHAVWAYPQQDLILLGSSAFGMVGDCNYQKVKDQKEYRQLLSQGALPLTELYQTPPRSLTLRRILMALHYNSIDLAQLTEAYEALPKRVKSLLFTLEKLRLIQRDGSRISTTEEGAFVTSLFWAKTMLSRMSN